MTGIKRDKSGRWKVLIVALTALLLSPAGVHAEEEDATSDMAIARNLAVFNSLYKELNTFYVDTINARKSIETAINAMLDDIDPYTEYIPAKQQEDFMTISTGEYGGIGSVIMERKGEVYISEPYEGSPAARAGLKAGDKIVMIDGDSVSGWGNKKVSEHLKGQPSTKLRVVVERPYTDSTLTFDITREKINVNPVPYYGVIRGNIGYIGLNTFSQKSADAVREALTELRANKAVKMIALDLRGNGGGLLGEAVKLVGLFVPTGSEVVSTRGKMVFKNQTFYTEAAPLDLGMPLVILTDFSTASAAEITAGALQDYDRAVIVGQRTYGKGLVQQPCELGGIGGGVLKVTTSKYYIPSGRCVQAYEFEDGTPRHLPDSLSKIFHTKAGREVHDCGGIAPDIVVKEDSLPNLITYLMLSNLVTDYVARYRTTHPTIDAPEQFHLTDAEYADFIAFLKENKFTYDRQSSKTLKVLRSIAELEGYAEQAKEQLDALESIFTRNEDYDYRKWEKQIRAIIEPAILTDYYYQRGAKEYDLRTNPTVARGLEILSSDATYHRVLSPAKP